MSIDDIINHVALVGVNLVEITGGEPLLQGEETRSLTEGLLNEGYDVMIETNGSFSIKEIDKRAIIILDVKTPGSGMSDEMDFANFDYLKPSDEVKFVLTDREDYDWARNLISENRLRERFKVLLAPAMGMLPPSYLAKWIIDDRLDVRLNIQIHKYIFGPDERMV